MIHRLRSLVATTAILLVATAVAGCTNTSDSPGLRASPTQPAQSHTKSANPSWVIDQPLTGAGGNNLSNAVKKVPTSPLWDRYQRCLEEAGWTVTRDYQGMVGIDNYPPSQQSAVQAAMDNCSKKTGLDKAWSKSTLSTSQLTELYKQELAEHECVLKIGLQSYHPPSLQTYIDTYATANQYYASRPGMDGIGSTNPAWRECPPPTYYMNLPGL